MGLLVHVRYILRNVLVDRHAILRFVLRKRFVIFRVRELWTTKDAYIFCVVL
jgi:hypothetical protein